jgi:hypothetical protein
MVVDRLADHDAIAAPQTEPAVIATLPQQPQLTQVAATDGLAPPPDIIPRADPRRIPDPVASARAEVSPDEPAPAAAKEPRAPKKKQPRRPDIGEAYMMPDGQRVFAHRPSRFGAGYEQWAGYDSFGYALPGLRSARPYGFAPPY